VCSVGVGCENFSFFWYVFLNGYNGSHKGRTDRTQKETEN
jgi:hypothetical protein